MQHMLAAMHLATGLELWETLAKIGIQCATAMQKTHGTSSVPYVHAMSRVVLALHMSGHAATVKFHRCAIAIAIAAALPGDALACGPAWLHAEEPPVAANAPPSSSSGASRRRLLPVRQRKSCSRRRGVYDGPR